ncbi:MAG TPA: class I SAM-dependent methyltransferase, partial [Kofleriaceae bacterium]|nr:class I SAM-dependent methyltransferase [Kofleriaceae bacterium]
MNEIEGVDFAAWLRRWDAQQAGYLPSREARFEAMLDAVAALAPEGLVAVDLACGPGSISQRLLARFPAARAVAVDLDPVLLAIGQRSLGSLGGRLRWVEADLMTADLTRDLGETQVDAVLSTTALHWLTPERLVQVYRQIAALLRPGGVFVNGDNIPFPARLPTFQKLAESARARDEAAAFAGRGVEDWATWWAAIAAEPGMRSLVAERDRRFTQRRR